MSLEAVWDLRIRIGAVGSAAAATTKSSSSTLNDDNDHEQEETLLPYTPRCSCVFATSLPPAAASLSSSSRENTNNSTNNTNPFDDAAAINNTNNTNRNGGVGVGGNSSNTRSPPPTPRAVVFGSEQGSLHYRCYLSPLHPNNSNSNSNSNVLPAASFGTLGTSSSPKRSHKNNSNNNGATMNVNIPQPALGVLPTTASGQQRRLPSPKTATATNLLSKLYYPVDLPPKSLPGPVIDIIPATTTSGDGINNSYTNNHNSNHNHRREETGKGTGGHHLSSSSTITLQQSQFSTTLFLVLVDDHGGSNKQGGLYAAVLVTLHNGAFIKLNMDQHGHGHDGDGGTSNNDNSTSSSSKPYCHPRFQLPSRISCGTYNHKCGGYVVCGGKRIITVPICQYTDLIERHHQKDSSSSIVGGNALSRMIGGGGGGNIGGNKQRHQQRGLMNETLMMATPTTLIDFSLTALPPPGARGGQDSLIVTSGGYVAVVAVGNSIYAIPGIEVDILSSSTTTAMNYQSATTTAAAVVGGGINTKKDKPKTEAPAYTKVHSFSQSSQIHPVILVDVNDKSINQNEWSALLVGNNRECAIIDLHHDSRYHTASVSAPRNGSVTTQSPILAAASSWPFITLLTSDGLISVRSTSCLAIPLKTVEVGTRPNDFFTMRSFRGGNDIDIHTIRRRQHQLQQRQYNNNFPMPTFNNSNENLINVDIYDEGLPFLLCMSYSGRAKVLRCRADTLQDLADRFMRISIDAFGGNGFPRNQLADALNASFTATSYVGPEPTEQSRNLLRQYLEVVLGLSEFESGAVSGWLTIESTPQRDHHTATTRMLSAATPPRNSGSYNPFMQNKYQQQPQMFSPTSGTFRSIVNNDANSSNNNNNNEIYWSPVVTEDTPNALLTGTALLCLVCTQLLPSPKGSLANKAARSCSSNMGVVVIDSINDSGISNSTIAVIEIVAERLLKEASHQSVSLLSNNSASRERIVASSGNRTTGNSRYNQASTHMEFVEAATWLLRSCGRHERAIAILYERFQKHRAPESARQPVGFWSQIKYESYTAAHLSELWSTQKEAACQLVLDSTAAVRLLEQNPELGLSVFTVNHPQNSNQWRNTSDHDDPLAHPKYPSRVVQLLKSIKPIIASYHCSSTSSSDEIEDHMEASGMLPLESGRALAATYLESAIGVSTNRPEEEQFDLLGKSNEYADEQLSDFHDELCFLLLEGVISERGDQISSNNIRSNSNSTNQAIGNRNNSDEDGDYTVLGRIYRKKLRRFLRWPLAKIRSERLLDSLPRSFSQEQALVLGRLGRHEEALKILYCNCKSMDLALEYCDMLHKQQKAQIEMERARLAADSMLDDRTNDELDEKFQKENAYLPLVRVALKSDPDKKHGIASAIKILAMRRGDVDRSAALRLLPSKLPVSAVARPFLIPALVDSESQTRRLKVVSSLLRAKHTALKHQLTDAQLKAQANLHAVQQFNKSMASLGEPLHSNKPFRARPSSSASSTFPDVIIVKHFFPRHVVIQATVTNNSAAIDGRALGNISFVVAESSEDAIQPSTQISIKVLPYHGTGSAWCVLVASPNRMEGTAILTCELRYSVMAVDTATGTPLNFGSQLGPSSGRAFVEELQDVEVLASHFT